MKYLVLIEQTSTGFAAYAPDLPGCVATGATRDQVTRRMKEAITWHIEALRKQGEPVPPPTTVSAEYIAAA